MSGWREWLLGAKVRVLRLRPGDVLVLEARHPVSQAEAEAMKRAWEARFPDVPVAVFSEGLHAGAVVRQEDEAK